MNEDIIDELKGICLIDYNDMNVTTQSDDDLDKLLTFFNKSICLIDIDNEMEYILPDQFDIFYSIFKNVCLIEDDDDDEAIYSSRISQLLNTTSVEYIHYDILDIFSYINNGLPLLIDEEESNLEPENDIVDELVLKKGVCVINDSLDVICQNMTSILIIGIHIDKYKNIFPKYKYPNINIIEILSNTDLKSINYSSYTILFCVGAHSYLAYLSHKKRYYQTLYFMYEQYDINYFSFYKVNWEQVDRIFLEQPLKDIFRNIKDLKNQESFLSNKVFKKIDHSRIKQIEYNISSKTCIIPRYLEHHNHNHDKRKCSNYNIGITFYNFFKSYRILNKVIKKCIQINTSFHFHIYIHNHCYSQTYDFSTFKDHITLYLQPDYKTFFEKIDVVFCVFYREINYNFMYEGICNHKVPIGLYLGSYREKQSLPFIYTDINSVINHITSLPFQSLTTNYLNIISSKICSLIDIQNIVGPYFYLKSYTCNNHTVSYMAKTSPHKRSYCKTHYSKNIVSRMNGLKIDMKVYQKANRLSHLSLIELYDHLQKIGIQKGLIYHPKQIENLLGEPVYLSTREDDMYISFKNLPCVPLEEFLEKGIYTWIFSDFIQDITEYHCQLKKHRLLILAYIGNKEIGIKLLNKIISYKEKQSFALVLCIRKPQWVDLFMNMVKYHVPYYAIYISKEYGNDIIPSLQAYYKVQSFTFDYIIKVQTKSDPILFKSITHFLFSKTLDELIALKSKTSNCVGLPSFVQSCQTGAIYPNQFLLEKYYSKKILDLNKKYVITTNFLCEAILFDKVIDFMSNHDFRSYFTNNMYDSNMIHYFNSPVHFIERLFGLIHI